jgi:hypothetical protein
MHFARRHLNATILPDGQPMVQRYDLQIFMIGAASPFQTNNLGKPSPDGAGKIHLSLATVLALALQLGQLPREVVLWVVEGRQAALADSLPDTQLSPEVECVVPRIAAQIKDELSHA